jgi:RNA polymerase sigma-70 factor (ECF subfamily)
VPNYLQIWERIFECWWPNSVRYVSRTSECQGAAAGVPTREKGRWSSQLDRSKGALLVLNTPLVHRLLQIHPEKKLMRSAAPNTASSQMNHTRIQTSDGCHCGFVDDADASLVSSLRAGDGRAYEVLVKRHQGRLFKVALRITNNREDAEDAVQNAFLNAFKHLDGFRGDSRLATWLTRITINQALMAMRAKPRKTISLDESGKPKEGMTACAIPAGGFTPEQICSQREFQRLLFAGTASMNARLRQVWWLRTVEDLEYREIAHVLGLTLAAAKTRLSRARRQLRKRLEKHICPANSSRTARI